MYNKKNMHLSQNIKLVLMSLPTTVNTRKYGHYKDFEKIIKKEVCLIEPFKNN